MPKAAGYLNANLTGLELFEYARNALNGTAFKFVSADDPNLIAFYKTSASLMNNSWGEKISLQVYEDKHRGSQVIVTSENFGKDEKFHQNNVKNILDLISNELKEGKKNTDSSGFVEISAATGAATAAGSTFFFFRTTEQTEVENYQSQVDGNEDGEGFWGSDLLG